MGKIFTKGGLEVADRVEAGSAGLSRVVDAPLPAISSGAVSARYLPQTRECSPDGTLEFEGEVDLHLACDNVKQHGLHRRQARPQTSLRF